jgi:hypothetical protein
MCSIVDSYGGIRNITQTVNVNSLNNINSDDYFTIINKIYEDSKLLISNEAKVSALTILVFDIVYSQGLFLN